MSSGGIKCPKSTSTIDLLDQIVDIMEHQQIVASKSFFFFVFFLKLDGETLQHRTQGEKDLLSPVSSVSVNFFFLLPGFTDEVSLNNCNFTLTKVMVILQKIIPTTIDLKSNQGRKLKKNFHG